MARRRKTLSPNDGHEFSSTNRQEIQLKQLKVKELWIGNSSSPLNLVANYDIIKSSKAVKFLFKFSTLIISKTIRAKNASQISFKSTIVFGAPLP